MDDRQARAERWLEGSRALIGTVEPEWWLRMMCGQLAQEDSGPRAGRMRWVVRRAEKRLIWRFRTRARTVGVEWLGALSRQDLPPEPVWWAR